MKSAILLLIFVTCAYGFPMLNNEMEVKEVIPQIQNEIYDLEQDLAKVMEELKNENLKGVSKNF